MQDHCFLLHLALKLEDGQLPLALEILDYATFAPILHLKMRHIVC